MKYYIWTIGCQMNEADSLRLASALERLGYTPVDRPEQADVVVLNTCVVRQSAEDKVYGRLGSLKPLKEQRPERVIGLMGCLVGDVLQDPALLRRRFPWVDVLMPPSEPGPLLELLTEQGLTDEGRAIEAAEVARRYRLQDGDLLLPARERGALVLAYVPVVLGCSHACSYCIIPYRRGVERSRPPEEIVAEAKSLAAQGVKQITLLGQIVDRYGLDLQTSDWNNNNPRSLADLLRQIHEIEGLERIRFLTSHPSWMTDDLLDAVAELPKVCEHIEVPVQAGDDEVLSRMRRGYTVDDYRKLIVRIRNRLGDNQGGHTSGASIATDIIVGFPGETVEQFQHTYDLLVELRLDKAHIARYSPRPQTLAARRFPDDVPLAEKERRRKALDDLQSEIVGEINARLLGQTVEALVEGKDRRKGRWYGRTRTDKLVFFEDERDWRGRMVNVRVTWAGPWSLIGEVG
ncbi:MAG: tRNA (N6-isopentenyl adenosine(37)-C2)-methylthiotransferase MiaB [Chloroflexi bacterium]|nr:MAG: tRNA (N6-isopentenyl adenosine(37)-C2)-methylthiotransferase MiaB [Chloroflexota bacterium]RLC82732.1 MAG: tRNA (N6-isopentenyl adenosine(37)-C2)-methylthiotransferase MiaB [Chloroflexota bacterium]